MSNLVIPRREILTQQPTKPSGINLANPLARGVSVWLATSPHVFYGNRNLVAVSESGYNSSPVGKEGVARKWNRAAAAGVDFGTQQIFTGQAVTVMVIAAPTSTVDMKAAFSQRAASGAYPQVDFIFNGSNDGLSASAGTVELVTYDGGSRGVTATSQLDGNVHCWVASNSTTLGYIIKDGVTQSLSQDTRVVSAIYASNQKLCIGRMGDDAGSTIYQHNDPLYMVAVWPWQLSIAEAKLVSANPWQIFAPRETRLFVPIGGGGAVNATASGAFPSVSLSANTAGASGSASASGSLAAITLSAPTATASAGGSATASGSFAALSISPATATAAAGATASGALAVVSISAPTATASGTTAGGAVATGAPAQITINPATASAIGSAVASGAFAALSITPPTATATSAGDAHAIAAFAALSINPTTGAAYGSAIATGSLPVISLSPATGTASTGTFTGSISDEDITRIVQAVLAALNATTIPVDMQKTNGVEIVGDGSSGNKFRSVLYVG